MTTHSLLFGFIALAALTGAPPGQAPGRQDAIETSASSDLTAALGAANVAEIYVLNRSILFVGRPGPEIVRLLGCKYFLYRDSPAWRDLEQSLMGADVRITPTGTTGEVRVGLILGDGAGILHEVYARFPGRSETRVTGFSARRPVEISASFVRALEGFASRHPDLQVIDGSRRTCSAA